MQRSYEFNVERYRWLQFSSGLYGWMPVFFLYFNQYVSLAETIQLGAIYYISVCFWEVPSGYLSDKVGRKLTLMFSAFSLMISYSFFLAASDFLLLALGQTFLAMGIAMISGTDTAFLYDSLIRLGREQEYAEKEAQGQKWGFGACALASLAGGLVASIHLSFAYWLSMIGAIWMFGVVWSLQEVDLKQSRTTESLSKTVIACLLALKDRILGWLFMVMVLMYCLEHITFEFYQPYIRLLHFDWIEGDNAALISAVIISLSMFGGTVGAMISVRLYNRFGVKLILMGALLFQFTILSALAATLSAAMLLMVVFRNLPMAIVSAPVNATIAPRIGSHLRATYLSIQSLASRLMLSVVLFFLSKSIDSNSALDWLNLSEVLMKSLIFGVIGVALMLVLAPQSSSFKTE